MPLTQDQAYDLLESAKERQRLGHAFLITGEVGVGKADLAKRIIAMLNAPKEEDTGTNLFGEEIAPPPLDLSKDLDEMESEFIRVVRPRSKSRLIRVDDMRNLEDSFYMSAPTGQWKIGVIVDADRMNESAANAFLKTLEEPPENCLLLLLTTAPDRLLTTILSRCISIPLYNPDKTGLSELQSTMNRLLEKTLSRSARGIASSLSLKTDFDLHLKEQKDVLAKKYKALLKEDAEALKNVQEKSFLKEKEEQGKAEEAAEYLGVRTESVNALISWFGDLIRWKVGHTPSHFTNSTELYANFAEDLCIDNVLQRIEALEELRYLLTETNVSEALALETSFMKAFA